MVYSGGRGERGVGDRGSSGQGGVGGARAREVGYKKYSRPHVI